MEVAPGKFYINSGDWIKHRTYVTIDGDGRPSMLEFELALT
jgi:hypothetical protein